MNELPEFRSRESKSLKTEFFSEKIFINDLDYYYSNSISRASKNNERMPSNSSKGKKNWN